MHLHQFHEVNERFAAHHAVSVAADKVAVALAPGVEEVADVAALALLVEEAAAIVNFSERIKVADEFGPAALLLDPAVGIRRIAQDEKIKALKLAGAGERFVGRAQAFEDADGIFVVNRENDGGAGAVNFLLLVIFQRRDPPACAEDADEKSIHAVHAEIGRA